MMRSPFAPWTAAEFRALFTDAGWESVRVTIEVWPLRYPSSDEFLRQEASASPLAGAVAAMTAAGRDALLADVRNAVRDYTADDGVACPIQVYVAVAENRLESHE